MRLVRHSITTASERSAPLPARCCTLLQIRHTPTSQTVRPPPRARARRYIVNFTITCFVGIFQLWFYMRIYNALVERYNVTLLRSGSYGNPPSWKPWLAQMIVWGMLAAGEKFVTAALILMPLEPHLDGSRTTGASACRCRL